LTAIFGNFYALLFLLFFPLSSLSPSPLQRRRPLFMIFSLLHFCLNKVAALLFRFKLLCMLSTLGGVGGMDVEGGAGGVAGGCGWLG